MLPLNLTYHAAYNYEGGKELSWPSMSAGW